MTSLLDSKICTFLLTWWLAQQVIVLAVPATLDMAPNAFDDQYQGCVEQMERKAPQLLQEDLNRNPLLKQEWNMARQWWNVIKSQIPIPKGFHDSHGIAVVAYTGKIYRDFNSAVREFRKKPDNFHYKGFHYYLTRALQLLSTMKCNTVYRGTTIKFEYSGRGSVRFGQFTSTSLSEEAARKFVGPDGTLFIIKTCLGAYIRPFSYYPYEEEVLVPGYEVYSKVTVKQNVITTITLDSPERKKSTYNCHYSRLLK